jgi:hypothetical protein
MQFVCDLEALLASTISQLRDKALPDQPTDEWEFVDLLPLASRLLLLHPLGRRFGAEAVRPEALRVILDRG